MIGKQHLMKHVAGQDRPTEPRTSITCSSGVLHGSGNNAVGIVYILLLNREDVAAELTGWKVGWGGTSCSTSMIRRRHTSRAAILFNQSKRHAPKAEYVRQIIASHYLSRFFKKRACLASHDVILTTQNCDSKFKIIFIIR